MPLLKSIHYFGCIYERNLSKVLTLQPKTKSLQLPLVIGGTQTGAAANKGNDQTPNSKVSVSFFFFFLSWINLNVCALLNVNRNDTYDFI